MDSLESVRAWRKAKQNIAARKPEPKLTGANNQQQTDSVVLPAPSVLLVQPNPSYGRVGGDDFHAKLRAIDVLEGAEEDLDSARLRLMISDANTAEMKEAEVMGKFLKKTEVDSAIFEIARAMRDGLTNCARRIAADVAALDKAEDCEAVIDREHRALLDSMTHRISSKLGASTAGVAA